MALTNTGICDKLRKITIGTQTTNPISGISDRLPKNVCSTPTRESSSDTDNVRQFDKDQNGLRQSIITVDRETHSISFGCVSRTIALQISPNAENQSVVSKPSKLQLDGNTPDTVSGGTAMVEISPPRMEWQEHNYACARSNHNDRQLKTGLGGGLQWYNNTGTVEPERTNRTYQCIGTASSNVCGEVIHSRKNKHSRSHSSGQSDDNVTNQQDGWNTVRKTFSNNERVLAILHIETDHSYSRISAGITQPDCRSGIQSVHGSQQLDAEQHHLAPNRTDLGISGGGPLCGSPQYSEETVRQLEARSGGNSNGCIQHKLEESQSVPVSSIQHDCPLPGKDKERPGYSNIGDTSVAGTTMVSHDIGYDSESANFITTITEHPRIPQRGPSSTNSDQRSNFSGMENLRQRLQTQGFSEQSSTLLLDARRASTQTAYAGPWKKWCSWCDRQKINPVQATVGQIANFITSRLELGLEYTTLNSYRSAISAYHPEVDGVKVGKHPMITQLLRGVFNRKPPKPRYIETWDVNIVLGYIKDMGINLSLKELTLKLTMLLALTTVARTSELHKLDPNWMLDKGDCVIFHIVELTKTKRPSKPQLTLTVHNYPHEQLLDVVSCLRLYLTKTKGFRKDTNQKHRLFLSLNKPYKPVVACTIARWLKTLMEKAGVDTSIFKAHSTRAASTSKAKKQGVSTSQIVKCANWARATTFEKFYHKKIVTPEQKYQNVVLALTL